MKYCAFILALIFPQLMESPDYGTTSTQAHNHFHIVLQLITTHIEHYPLAEEPAIICLVSQLPLDYFCVLSR